MDNKPIILIVDDLPTNLDVLSTSISSQYQIRVALSGKRALQLAEKEPQPNLILLDIMMPEMDGYEVCRNLKSNPLTKNIPVIFVTASHAAVDEVQALEVGGVDFISKPITPAIVQARVKTHLLLSNQAIHLKALVESKTKELQQSKDQVLNTLSRAAEYKDNETSNHVNRMSLYSELIAKRISNDEEWIRLVKHSAKMHDIGKIGVEDSILLKAGKLSDDEWEKMKKHVEIGGKIIEDESTPIMKMSKDVALYHHEKWDGTGYAKGLKGKDIPLAARIVAIADVFDALTSNRPYKKSWSMDEALGYISEQAGIHFDPELVQHFLDAKPEIIAIKAQFEH